RALPGGASRERSRPLKPWREGAVRCWLGLPAVKTDSEGGVCVREEGGLSAFWRKNRAGTRSEPVPARGPADAGPSQDNNLGLLSTPRPVFLPETFSGSGRDWSDWAEQFEIAADVNNWDDALKLKFMSLLLSGRAREVYSGLSPSAKANYLSLSLRACTEGPMPAPTCERNAAFKSLMGGSGYLKAKIGGFDCHALIDTGASRSVISKSMWLVITNGGTDLGNYVGKATTVNGGQLVVLGSWQTVCELTTLTLPVEFLVSELTADEILLGFDFLAKHSAIVDLGKNVCQIKGKCFPLVPSNPSPAAKVVVIHSDPGEGSHRLHELSLIYILDTLGCIWRSFGV
uniref:Peptidase A2 domain-containing protein n=1 Tax=Oryzias latipes TaxID=8090 RepID=A0A3P9JN09_ORYLA